MDASKVEIVDQPGLLWVRAEAIDQSVHQLSFEKIPVAVPAWLAVRMPRLIDHHGVPNICSRGRTAFTCERENQLQDILLRYKYERAGYDCKGAE